MGRQDLLPLMGRRGGHTFASVEPATGQQLADVGSASTDDLRRAVQRANDAQPGWAATRTTLERRCAAGLGQVFRSVQPHPEIRTDSEPLQRLGSNAKDAKSDTNFRTLIADSPSRRLCEGEIGWLGRCS
jgi:hypothetical protein